ncbi:hypothetical protein AAMO2058_000099300 [Amorphochlora amoebiformis]
MSITFEPTLLDSNLLSPLKCCDDIIDSFYDFRNLEDLLDSPQTFLRETHSPLLGKHETCDKSRSSSRSTSTELKTYLNDFSEQHDSSSLRETIEEKSTTTEEASIEEAMNPIFFSGVDKIAARSNRNGNHPPIASLCALCIVEGVLEAANQSVRKGRGQLCDRHIEAIESRNVFEARFCMYMAARDEKPDLKEKDIRGKTFRLTSKRVSRHKLLTFTSDDDTVSANLLRIHISPKSASGFPYRQNLFCMHPRAIWEGNHATHVQYQSLVSSDTFKKLSGPDHPVLAYKASNGRIAMFKFSGLAAQSSGAIDTGLYCTQISSPRRDSPKIGKSKLDLESLRRHVLATHRQMVNLAHLIPEAFTSKVRIIDTQPDGRTWFQLPLSSRELEEFERCLSTLKTRHFCTLSMRKPLEISRNSVNLVVVPRPPEGNNKEKKGWERKEKERDTKKNGPELRKRKREDGIQGEIKTPKLLRQRRLVSEARRPGRDVLWMDGAEGLPVGSLDWIPLSLPLCAFSRVFNTEFTV